MMHQLLHPQTHRYLTNTLIRDDHSKIGCGMLKARLHYAQFLVRHGKTGTGTIFTRAGTTYLHGPSTDKIGTVACFIRAMPKIERSVNGP